MARRDGVPHPRLARPCGIRGGRYVGYRKKAKLHYAAAGGPRAVGDLGRVLKWIESLRGGLLEDPQSGTYSIDGKAAAWPAEALADAKMTDQRCAKCRKPVPGYRKTYKWCGVAAGAGGGESRHVRLTASAAGTWV